MTLPRPRRTLPRMLPLSGDRFPTTRTELTEALAAGASAHALQASVSATGERWPELDSLAIDLTGSHFTRELRLPVATAPAEGELLVQRLTLSASPMEFEQVPLRFALRGEQVALGFARSANVGPLLSFARAQRGEVEAEVQRADLEALLLRLASDAASAQGVQVKKTTLTLTARDPRTLAFRAEVTAKMFIMSAAVTLAGELAIDDQFAARLSQLRVSGEGMIGTMVNGLARAHLEKWEGRAFPLLALPLGGLKLRAITIAGGDSLRVRAEFGEE